MASFFVSYLTVTTSNMKKINKLFLTRERSGKKMLIILVDKVNLLFSQNVIFVNIMI